MTIADSLTLLNNTKQAIKDAIEDKGVTVGAIPFAEYPDKISEISGGGGDDWVRPADWLPMPSMTDTDEAFYGLVAIFPDDSQFIALSASGAYTVDWGDGTVQNFSSGAQANYQYDYNNPALDGTESSRGYKQAIVTVTPQSGSNLTALSLNVKHNQSGLQLYTAGWLDILCGSPNFSTAGLVIGQTSAAETVRKNFIERVRILNLGNTNTFANRFQNLRGLRVIELPDTSAVTNMSNAFNGCSSLQTVPLFNTQNVTNMSNAFSGCNSLTSVPALNTTAVTSSTNFGAMFSFCNNLARIEAKDFRFTFSVANCKLSADALDEIYTNLPTVTGQTITVTGNWGTATDDPTIATAKGWTVTG